MLQLHLSYQQFYGYHNSLPRKTRISTLYKVNIRAADGLAMQGAMRSAAMVLALFAQNILGSVSILPFHQYRNPHYKD